MTSLGKTLCIGLLLCLMVGCCASSASTPAPATRFRVTPDAKLESSGGQIYIVTDTVTGKSWFVVTRYQYGVSAVSMEK